MPDDRRNYIRFGTQSLVSFTLLHALDASLETGMARSTDLSLKGIHLELPQQIKQHDLLSLTLSIEGQLVSVSGRVVWTEPGDELQHVGVEILHVPVEYEAQIQNLLRRRDDNHQFNHGKP